MESIVFDSNSREEIFNSIKNWIEQNISTECEIELADLSRGINQFGHFVYLGNFRIEQAQLAGAKAAYLAAIVMTKYSDSLMKFDEKIPLEDYLITHPQYIFLNKQLKSVLKGEALFYWNETIKLLHP